MLAEALHRILSRRQAYRRVFNVEDGDVRLVLADLRRFCGVERAAYRVSPVTRQIDPNATMIAVGRLEVYQRIEAFLKFNDADLAKIQDHQPEEDRKHD